MSFNKPNYNIKTYFDDLNNKNKFDGVQKLKYLNDICNTLSKSCTSVDSSILNEIIDQVINCNENNEFESDTLFDNEFDEFEQDILFDNETTSNEDFVDYPISNE